MKRKFKKYRRFKKRKSILKNRFFWDFILISALIILVFYFFFLSGMFKIQKIEILAPENIPKNELQDILEQELKTSFLYFFQKDSFFLVNDKEVEDKILKEYPDIKEVNLKKKFPKTLILEIKEREEAAIWCINDNSCFSIDKEGVILGDSTPKISKIEGRENLMVIFLENGEIRKSGETVISEDELNQLFLIENELGKKLEIGLEKFTLVSEERLNVKTIDGWKIYFDLTGDINLDLTKLRLLLEKEIPPEDRENLQYIDLRFSKVYYK